MAVKWLKVVLPIAGGFGLYQVGHALEAMGDVAKGLNDVSSALACHLFALLLMLAALGAFIFALVNLFRGLRGGDGDTPMRFGAATAAIDAEPAFDADAVMARYLATRQGGAPVAETEVRPDPRGFGRKR